ncbi:hypothetical protein PR048_003979 [Dryococelus australis]|uniref:Uncharacterized protein n=1 Tax=Dryococelus australis TaxID=614101 RepID=A0ABQ9I499_9NEOP|nr:hypothetical protein PR048_003979 [Dryococelus australis]
MLTSSQNQVDRQAEDVNEEILLDYGDLNGINLSGASNEENVATYQNEKTLQNCLQLSHVHVMKLLYMVGTFYPGQVTDIHDELYKLRCILN